MNLKAKNTCNVFQAQICVQTTCLVMSGFTERTGDLPPYAIIFLSRKGLRFSITQIFFFKNFMPVYNAFHYSSFSLFLLPPHPSTTVLLKKSCIPIGNFVFKMGILLSILADLELTMQTKLGPNSQWSSCLCFPMAGTPNHWSRSVIFKFSSQNLMLTNPLSLCLPASNVLTP